MIGANKVMPPVRAPLPKGEGQRGWGRREADLVQGEAAWGAMPLLALICCSSQVTGHLYRTWSDDLPLHPLCSNTSAELYNAARASCKV